MTSFRNYILLAIAVACVIQHAFNQLNRESRRSVFINESILHLSPR